MNSLRFKQYSLVVLIVILVIMITACSNNSPSNLINYAEYDVIVEVVDADTGNNLENVNLTVEDYKDNLQTAVSTDTTGVYKFKDVNLNKESKFIVNISLTGYVSEDITLVADGATIDVTGDKAVTLEKDTKTLEMNSATDDSIARPGTKLISLVDEDDISDGQVDLFVDNQDWQFTWISTEGECIPVYLTRENIGNPDYVLKAFDIALGICMSHPLYAEVKTEDRLKIAEMVTDHSDFNSLNELVANRLKESGPSILNPVDSQDVYDMAYNIAKDIIEIDESYFSDAQVTSAAVDNRNVKMSEDTYITVKNESYNFQGIEVRNKGTGEVRHFLMNGREGVTDFIKSKISFLKGTPISRDFNVYREGVFNIDYFLGFNHNKEGWYHPETGRGMATYANLIRGVTLLAGLQLPMPIDQERIRDLVVNTENYTQLDYAVISAIEDASSVIDYLTVMETALEYHQDEMIDILFKLGLDKNKVSRDTLKYVLDEVVKEIVKKAMTAYEIGDETIPFFMSFMRYPKYNKGAVDLGNPYSVGGNITYGDSGLPDVEVNFSNDFMSVTTDEEGVWSKSHLVNEVEITPQKEGYIFEPESVVVTEDNRQEMIDFVAEELQKYTLDLTGNNISSTPEPGNIIENTEVIIEVNPPSGKKVDAFTVNSIDKKNELLNIPENEYTFNITEDTIVEVTYKDIPQYNLTIDVVGEGTTTPSEGSYEYEEGTQITLSAEPADDWLFNYWGGDVQDQNNAETTMTMNGDKEITAMFEKVGEGDVIMNLDDSPNGQIFSLDISSDDSMVAAGEVGGTVMVWDLKTGEIITQFTGHDESVESVKFSSDNSMIISGSDDGTVKIWDIDSGEELNNFSGHHQEVYSLDISSDASMIVSGGWNGSLKVLDVDSGEVITDFTEHYYSINAVEFSSDDSMVVSGAQDETVKVWDPIRGEVKTNFTEHSSEIFSVDFSADGSMVVSGSQDGNIMVWSTYTGEIITNFTEHESIVYSVEFSSNDTLIVSGSLDGSAKVWDVDTGEVITNFTKHDGWNGTVVYAADFSSDNSMVASSGNDGYVKLWLWE